jgi:hypothetical protein
MARSTRIIAILALVVVAGIVADLVAGAGSAPPMQAAVTGPRVHGGTTSMDELLARFLEAVRAKDRGALEELRFTEDEYRNVIFPGSVEKGSPPQALGQKASKYFFDDMNTRSFYHRENILKLYGGKQFTLKEFDFKKGIKEYAGYTAYRRLRLILVDEAGNEVKLQTGSVAEVDGHFKFASYVRD